VPSYSTARLPGHTRRSYEPSDHRGPAGPNLRDGTVRTRVFHLFHRPGPRFGRSRCLARLDRPVVGDRRPSRPSPCLSSGRRAALAAANNRSMSPKRRGLGKRVKLSRRDGPCKEVAIPGRQPYALDARSPWSRTSSPDCPALRSVGGRLAQLVYARLMTLGRKLNGPRTIGFVAGLIRTAEFGIPPPVCGLTGSARRPTASPVRFPVSRQHPVDCAPAIVHRPRPLPGR
jgi:hypothetical protein